MVIREALVRTFDEYPRAREEEFAGHPFAAWMRHDVPEIFQAEMADFPNIVWAASPGKGGWAHAPWIAAFDPLVTETAQEGFYPVYVFNRHLDIVYLSLNQGMARLRDELGTRAKETLSHRASILRGRVSPAYRERFSADPIDLDAPGSQSRLAFYEPGHAFGTRYLRDHLPSQEAVARDLAEMLSLYATATIMGGTQELETTCLLYTSPSPRDRQRSRMPSSA